MAKSKKQSQSEQAPAKKAASKSAKTPPKADPSLPAIDTNLAAEAAAKMVAQRAAEPGGDSASTNDPSRKESSSFKQMKQNLAKSNSGGIGNLLGGVQGQKKSHQQFGGRNQVGRNQRFGADVNRSSVPRRTGGG